MPERLKENVEDTVKDDGSSEATCAIIRMETLPAFDDEELRESGNPLGCFLVYMGTDPSNVEYTVSWGSIVLLASPRGGWRLGSSFSLVVALLTCPPRASAGSTSTKKGARRRHPI